MNYGQITAEIADRLSEKMRGNVPGSWHVFCHHRKDDHARIIPGLPKDCEPVDEKLIAKSKGAKVRQLSFADIATVPS